MHEMYAVTHLGYDLTGFKFSEEEGYRFHATDKEYTQLANFFRAQEDLNLDRWRWPKNPQFLVQEQKNGSVTVCREDLLLDENGGISIFYPDDVNDDDLSLPGRAARDYWKENQPKPQWVKQAQLGDVWAVTTKSRELYVCIVCEAVWGLCFIDPYRNEIPLESPAIVHAERILDISTIDLTDLQGDGPV